MKITLSQLNSTIGDFHTNAAKVKQQIQEARGQGVNLLVFPTFTLEGYPAFDLYSDSAFQAGSSKALEALKEDCIGISCLIGGLYQRDGELFHAAYLLEEGGIKTVITKKRLSCFDWMDESRYFSSGDGVQGLTIQGKTILVALGEDVLDIQTAQAGVDLVIHLNPIAFDASINKYKQSQSLCEKIKLPLLEVNVIGGQGDMLFEGRSLLWNAQAKLLEQWASFGEESKSVSLSQLAPQLSGDIAFNLVDIDPIERIHDALIMGIRDFFAKQGFKKAVLGLSGGLDSALVAALACEALGAANVLCILLPSIHSTEHSLKDAFDLVENTGCHHKVVEIKDLVMSAERLLEPLFNGIAPDLTEENIQARSRSLLLMAISNKFGHIVLNTSNKSECAVGYGTLYGDMVGSLSVLGDLYKTRAYELARYMNREREIIPIHTIEKAPSAELRPGQKDSDSLPDYPVMDAILFEHIELGKNSSEIIALGHDQELVEKTLKLMNNTAFKRYQAPPILRISSKAFGRAMALPVVYK